MSEFGKKFTVVKYALLTRLSVPSLRAKYPVTL